MARIIIFLAVMMTAFAIEADVFSYHFKATPLPKAVRKIMEEHPDLDVNFIFNELENYKTSATVMADNPFDALQQTIGLNPVTVVKSRNTYYLEALQHGKYLYTGKAVGSDNEPVVAATVLLHAPKDSTVITYAVTDDAGRFSIPCDRQVVIAKLSCVGYRTTYKRFNSFNVGTILMAEIPIHLKAITVEENNASLLSDRSIYRPSQRQKNASQTAIDLLRNIAMPQITVNLVDEAVTTPTGSPVAVYVNGFPASKEELSGMRPSDVRIVEYLDFPIDPRFSGNEHVINFILQKYEYGGYTKISVSENILTGLSSRTNLYSKFSHKRMVYDLYAGASNLDLHNTGSSITGRYILTDSEGEDFPLIRKEESKNSHFKSNEYPVSFRAIYDSDKIQIGNTFGFNYDGNPLAETHGELSYSDGNKEGYSYKKEQPSATRHFIWSGAYYFSLPNNYQLSISPRANYGHTNYSYSYKNSQPESMTISNFSRENSYVLSGGASLYKVFSKRHSGQLNIYGGTNRNDVKYMGSSQYDNSFSDSFTGVRLGYSYNAPKWKFSSDAALQWECNGINGENESEIYPLINISGRFTPSSHHSLQAFFHYGANYPAESVKSPNVLQDNELMYKTGNPELPLSRQITFNLNYNWIANNQFSLSLYSEYFGEYGLYVPMFETYNDGSALLKTYTSDQDYNRTRVGLSFNLKLLEGSLQLASQPSVSIFRYNGCYNMAKNPFAINASATYYYKRLFLQASYQSANKTIQGNYGVWYKTKNFYQLQAGWGNANWNIRLSAINMFRGSWDAATQSLNSPLYSECIIQGGTYYHRRINFSATYTFGYGKKVAYRSNGRLFMGFSWHLPNCIMLNISELYTLIKSNIYVQNF